MQESIKSFLKVGLVHYMAYPSVSGGEGNILDSVRRICLDDYYDLIEVAWIKDPAVRAQVAHLVKSTGMQLMYGAHPRLLKTGQNINDPEEGARLTALDNLKEGVDEAYQLGAKAFAFLSGGYTELNRQVSYEQLLKSTIELCSYAGAKGDMKISLSVFDHDVDKKCLIGPTGLAVRLAEDVRKAVSNFGLLVDLTHIPLLHETIEQALIPAAPYLNHVHIGNTVITPGQPAYGDQHPRFGFPGSVNGVPEIVRFLRVLFKIGYLSSERQATLSFEIKPFNDEDPEIIIANAKRYLNEAWAVLKL